MRIVFMGTPSFAVSVLSALVDAGHDLAGVYSQPDRPTGRGRRTSPTPVKVYAQAHGLEVSQPASLRRDVAARGHVAGLGLEVIVVAAYGLYLPAEVVEAPRLGCLNVHPSLLPEYRGPSPVASAILNGDDETGVTVMKITEQMDSGPVVARKKTPIDPEETAGALTDRLFRMGAGLMVEVLPKWEVGDLQARPQDDSLATTTRLLSREDGEIDWMEPAARVARQVRAYDPWPGTFSRWDGRRIKVLGASAIDAAGTGEPAGTVMPLPGGSFGVVTGDGVLELRRLQLEGRRQVGAKDFAQGQPGFVGTKLGR